MSFTPLTLEVLGQVPFSSPEATHKTTANWRDTLISRHNFDEQNGAHHGGKAKKLSLSSSDAENREALSDAVQVGCWHRLAAICQTTTTNV